MLRILAACLHHQWKHHQTTQENIAKRPTFQRTDTDIRDISEGAPPTRIDPPPLDDTFAKHLISLMFRFLSLFGGSTDDRDYIANTSKNTAGPSVFADIYETAGRIMAYVSASNWDVVFSKFRARLMQLKSTAEETTEVTDLAALENVSLNSKRLSMILTGK
ncbi:hypothetical protein G6F56_012934 [Rhizopus delemar]|nr:hypothetical protein G6F56_012934 [Rhizopus delemar]